MTGDTDRAEAFLAGTLPAGTGREAVVEQLAEEFRAARLDERRVERERICAWMRREAARREFNPWTRGDADLIAAVRRRIDRGEHEEAG